MRCQFCTQWNPDDAADCAFCGNELRGALDATIEGRPAYESARAGRNAAVERQVAALASARPDPGPVAVDSFLRSLAALIGGRHRSAVAATVVMLLAYLVYKLSEC
jgi:hypothetical protein